jgi:hypothetical protein
VQWLNGERKLETLLQEPQGKLSPLLKGDAAATQNTSGSLEAGKLAAALKAESEPVHPQSLQIVQQQLQALDTRQIVWMGQIWPGQDMKWEIEEEATRQGGEDEETTRWSTHLNLQLPSLGGVNAKLAFVDSTIRVDIAADSEDSVDRMRQAQEALAQRFEASGLTLSGLNIHHE